MGKMVLDAIKATKIKGLARWPWSRPGESWVELLRFARERRATVARSRVPCAAGALHSYGNGMGWSGVRLWWVGCGRLGIRSDGPARARQYRPSVAADAHTYIVTLKEAVQAVSAGNTHSLAVTVSGAVWSLGRGRYGRLGLGYRLPGLVA